VIDLWQILVFEEQPAPGAPTALFPKQGGCPPRKRGVVSAARRPVEPVTIKGAFLPLHLRMPPNGFPIIVVHHDESASLADAHQVALGHFTNKH
jgi:hypothetical protein